jgi:putative peptide maturation system protein
MLETHHAVLTDVLSCLEGISRENVLPTDAQREINAVRSRHPAASIELVWDEQEFDSSRHYDALIRPQGFSGTVSLSVCHDEGLPWPLRGLQPGRDSELLRVNGTVMSVENAIRQLDMLWHRKPLMQRLIDSCLIETELERRQIEVTPAEVQQTVDDMRRRRGLLTTTDTHAWLASSGMSMHGLTEIAVKLARAAKLRDLIVGQDVDRYLEQHRESFDAVNTRVLQTPDARIAQQVTEAVRGGSRPFLDAAQEAFFCDSTGRTQLFYRKEPRHRLAERLRDATAAFRSGDLLGPLDEGDERLLIHVVSVEPAERNPHLRSAVVARLFDDWLREQRQHARTEWFWGPHSATKDATK